MYVCAGQDLKDSVVKLLKMFHQKSRLKPERIIFMRDGVSEGQFPHVRTTSKLPHRSVHNSLLSKESIGLHALTQR